MIVFKLIVQHETIISVTEMSSKMAQALCQILLTIFCQKNHTILFKVNQHVVQILIK